MLSGSRQVGMGVGPIPLSEIKAYLELFPDPDPGTMIRLVMAMDRVYIEHHANKFKKNH